MVVNDRRSLAVLLVDDCKDTVRTEATLLRAWGHSVSIANTGDEALRLAEQSPPDVVLLDLGLPGMDGWEVARRMRQRLPAGRCLIVAVSGYGQEEDRRRSRDAGCDLHLIKPVDPVLLEEMLDLLRKVG